jgi:hypothetical protein
LSRARPSLSGCRFGPCPRPERADPERVRYVFEIKEARDVNGDPIELPEDPVSADVGQGNDPGSSMTDAEWNVFRVAVQQCWVVDPGAGVSPPDDGTD